MEIIDVYTDSVDKEKDLYGVILSYKDIQTIYACMSKN